MTGRMTRQRTRTPMLLSWCKHLTPNLEQKSIQDRWSATCLQGFRNGGRRETFLFSSSPQSTPLKKGFFLLFHLFPASRGASDCIVFWEGRALADYAPVMMNYLVSKFKHLAIELSVLSLSSPVSLSHTHTHCSNNESDYLGMCTKFFQGLDA